MSLNSIIEYTESRMTIPPKTSSDLLPDNHVNKFTMLIVCLIFSAAS